MAGVSRHAIWKPLPPMLNMAGSGRRTSRSRASPPSPYPRLSASSDMLPSPRSFNPFPSPFTKPYLHFDPLPSPLANFDCSSPVAPLPPHSSQQRIPGRKRSAAVSLSSMSLKVTPTAPDTPERSSDHEVHVRRRRKIELKKKETSDGSFPPNKARPDLALVPVEESESRALDVGPLYDTAIPYQGPFPTFPRPSPEECREVRDRLWQLHGPLEEYARGRISCPTREDDQQVLALEYRKDNCSITKISGSSSTESSSSTQSFSGLEVAPTGHPRDRRSVLDSLVGTILSQNTTDKNSRRAFACLKARFPTWEQVYMADPKAVEEAIRCGGLSEIKSSRILNILDTLHQERGKLCLEYVRKMSIDEIKLELCRFKGVGPKTAACVLMFHLKQDEFPVDTHVFRITKMLGWVPESANREKAYMHLNHRVPNDVKFDLHCLLVTHGKSCPLCAKGGRIQRPADGVCPLVGLISEPLQVLECDVLSIEPAEKSSEEQSML